VCLFRPNAAPLQGEVVRSLRNPNTALAASGPVRATAQDATPPSENGGKCHTAGEPPVDALSGRHWNGWGVDASQRRFQPSTMAQLPPDDVPHLKLKSAFGYPSAGRAFAQPTIVAGRLFVGTRNGTVYSLDANSGCTYGEFNAGKPVRWLPSGPTSGWLVNILR
jgi:outer membrane protein assembly factor BamB